MGRARFIIKFGIAPKMVIFKLIDQQKMTVFDAKKLIRKNVKSFPRMIAYDEHFRLMTDDEQIKVGAYLYVAVYT